MNVYICGLPKLNRNYEAIFMGPNYHGRIVIRMLENG